MEMITITAVIAAMVTTGGIIIDIMAIIMPAMMMSGMQGAKLPLLQRVNQTLPRKARCCRAAKSASSSASEARWVALRFLTAVARRAKSRCNVGEQQAGAHRPRCSRMRRTTKQDQAAIDAFDK